jgi:putative DNA methylase
MVWSNCVKDDRKLIEDYLPIQAISAEASREKSVRKGHISTLHLWWARRPLVACRAAVYGALVPMSRFRPANGPEEKRDSLTRANAAKFVERLCQYPGSPQAIAEAQKHILEAHAGRLSKETGKPVTVEDIVEGRAPRPKVLDMFAGGGAIPLEALRLGCEAYALDLNPVAHIIELCTLVYPQKFGKPDPNARGMMGPKNAKGETTWGGLAEEVRYWGNWVLEKVKAEIGDLYPLIPDPEYKGRGPESQTTLWKSARKDEVPPGFLVPVAYLWTRTVRCKNPTCGATVPLLRQTWLCKKKDRYVALKMIAPKGKKEARFEVVESRTEKGLGFDPAGFSKGGNATCPFCGTVADSDYVKAEGLDKRIGHMLMAIACSNPRGPGNIFLTEEEVGSFYPPQEKLDALQQQIRQLGISAPQQPISGKAADQVPHYGMQRFEDLFPERPKAFLLYLVALTRVECKQRMSDQGYSEDHIRAVRTALGIAIDRVANYLSSLCVWRTNRSCVLPTFSRQALAMVWDYGEMNPYSGTAGDWGESFHWVADVIEHCAGTGRPGSVDRGSADQLPHEGSTFDAVITDPPYYDNVIYADLADFFYVWLRESIGDCYPEHFAAELTPKRKEAVSSIYRFDSKKHAREFYEKMMQESFTEAHRVLKPGGPLICVYAHKTTVGWASLVDAMRTSEFEILEAWPVDTEMTGGMRVGTASLASSIFLVARKRGGAQTGSYEEDVRPELEKIVRERVDLLCKMGITGADLVIAAVGAGLRAFTRFARVEYANGEEVPAEKFLAEVEGVVLETLLEKIFGMAGSGVAAVDGPSRFYVLWRYAYKAAEMEAGEAIVFTYGQNVELDGQKGLSTGRHALVEKKKGKYRLRDFTERGEYEKLGLPEDGGAPAPLIDALHRILWLVENQPRALNKFLDEARPDRERLRLVAQALAGTALTGKRDNGSDHTVVTTAAEQAALKKLVANWRALIDQRLAADEGTLFDRGRM